MAISKLYFISCDDEDCEEMLGGIDMPEFSTFKKLIKTSIDSKWLIVGRQHFCPNHYGSYHRSYQKKNIKSLTECSIVEIHENLEEVS
jgi:hypothetical protein